MNQEIQRKEKVRKIYLSEARKINNRLIMTCEISSYFINLIKLSMSIEVNVHNIDQSLEL